MIHLHAVSKHYGDTTAVAEVTLDVAEAATTVLIGPSGCGKSTLVKMMNGLVVPDTGRVTVDDTALTPTTVRALRHRIGYVIQEGGLFPHLTAFDNAALLPRHLGWDAVRIRKRCEELADLVALPVHRLADYPAQLSGGQRQRVSLMRALMLDPALLLLDEPLGALDPMIRAQLQDDLRRIFRTLAKTVVLVTHDLAEASFFADTIVLLQHGRIVQEGTLADFRERPAKPFVTTFVEAQRHLHDG